MLHKEGFREDVQGLRAIAVLAVILFHIDPDLLPGGYIGVDVFFVISGYVITRSILRSMETGNFGLGKFFYARFRRLYPAALATVAASLLLGAYIFPPSPMVELAKSALYSLIPVSLANFYFMMDAGYWAANSITKPLLHMWSLAVEDQFYLIWPFLALVLLRARRAIAFAGIAAIIVIGAVVSEVGVRMVPTAAFFMVPFRIFEFAIGAILVFTEGRWTLHRMVHEAIVALSYAVLMFYFIVYDGANPFPGLAVVPALLAVAAIIQFGASPFAGRVLENRVSSFLGATSYSLYLVHWPIIVFYVYWAFRAPGTAEKIGLLAVTIIAGAALHYGVERRYRHYDFLANLRAAWVGAAASVLVAMVAGAFWAGSGIAARSSLFISDDDVKAAKSKRFTYFRAICRERGRENCGSVAVAAEGKKRVLVVGDSHAADGLNFAGPALGNEHLVLSGLGGCPPMVLDSKWWDGPVPSKKKCRELNEQRNDPSYLKQFDVLILSAKIAWYGPNDIDDFIRHARSANPNIKIIVLGAYYYLKFYCGDIIQRDKDRDCTKDIYVQSKFASNEELRRITESVGGLFIDKAQMCDGEVCPTFVSGAPFAWDSHHLSYEFARTLGERTAQTVRNFVDGTTAHLSEGEDILSTSP